MVLLTISIRGLKAELTKEWNQLPSELAVELINSMKSRIVIEALIKSNGLNESFLDCVFEKSHVCEQFVHADHFCQEKFSINGLV